MTRLEISVVITTVIMSFIIACCSLNSVSIVAQGRFDVIVVGSVVRWVVGVTADNPRGPLDPQHGILLVVLVVLWLPHNRTGLGEELSLVVVVVVVVVVVILLLLPWLLQLRSSGWWLSFRLWLLGEVDVGDGHDVMRSVPSN